MTTDKQALIDSVYKKRLAKVTEYARLLIDILNGAIPEIREGTSMLNSAGLDAQDRATAAKQIEDALQKMKTFHVALSKAIPESEAK